MKTASAAHYLQQSAVNIARIMMEKHYDEIWWILITPNLIFKDNSTIN
jgi:hypothetical protein